MVRIPVSDRLPFFSQKLSVVVLVFFIASLVVTPAATNAHTIAEPLDLAAMMLRTADLVDVGLDGFDYETSFQAHQPELIADWNAEFPLDDATKDVDAFRAAAPARGYISHLFDTSPLDPNMSGYVVVSFTFEYASKGAARAGFDVMTDIWLESETTETEEQQIPMALVRDQMLVVGTGSNPWDTEEIDRGSVAFRDGNLVGGIIMLNFLNDDPPGGQRTLPPIPEAIVELAKTQINRMDEVVQRGGPELSTMILRLDAAPGDVWFDFYPTMDAIVLCPSDIWKLQYEECIDWQAEVTARGEQYRYALRYAIGSEVDPNDPPSVMTHSVITFPDVETAEAYMDSYWKLTKTHENFPADYTVDEARLGDDAYTLSWSRAGTAWTYLLLQVRVDNTVFRLALQTKNEDHPAQTPAVSEAMLDLMEIQLACFEGEQSCIVPFPIPAGINPYDDPDSGFQQKGASLTRIRQAT